MLKDLILSIATPFNGSRPGSKSPSPAKQYPPILEDNENVDPLEVRNKYSSLLRRPRKSSDSKRERRKKSNSLPDSMEVARDFRKVSKSSSLNYMKSYPINILVVGARNVGKSALTVRFITRRYIGEYMSGENQTYNYIPDEKRHPSITFLDESNELEGDNFMASQLSDENLAWADGIMLVYDVGEMDTFTYAKKMINFMTDKFCTESDMSHNCNVENTTHMHKNSSQFRKAKIATDFKPILLIGNKADLVKRRNVSESDVKKAAEEFPPWVTCDQISAAEGYDDIVKCVNELILKIKEKRRYLNGLSSKSNLKNIVGNVFRNRSIKTATGTL